MSENIIRFNARERLLGKVNHYISAVEQLIRDGDKAIDLLLAAFAVADDDTKIKIVLLLGALANPKVISPLLTIMHDSDQEESVRQAAAIQISVVGGHLASTEELVDRLLETLKSDVPFDRANAAFAMGWEGNLRVAPYLIDCLLDTETEVQQAAVNALSNLQDDNIFSVLAKRLQKSAKEQQRAILYNLGHFTARHNEIAQICKTFIHHSDPDLRYDALMVLNSVSDPAENLALYEHCLQDHDARIRELTLIQLSEVGPAQLAPLEKSIRHLLKDDIVNVNQAAIRLLHLLRPATVVQTSSA